MPSPRRCNKRDDERILRHRQVGQRVQIVIVYVLDV
jgi:hypothetical protein